MSKRILTILLSAASLATGFAASSFQQGGPALGNCELELDTTPYLIVSRHDQDLPTNNDVVAIEMATTSLADPNGAQVAVRDNDSDYVLGTYRTYRFRIDYTFTPPRVKFYTITEDGEDGVAELDNFTSSKAGNTAVPVININNAAPAPGATILVYYQGWLTTIPLVNV